MSVNVSERQRERESERARERARERERERKKHLTNTSEAWPLKMEMQRILGRTRRTRPPTL